MRNYIILNNKSSNDINGLIIQELAPISKPQQRTQVETIDGRDGDIVTPLGYAAYNKKIKIGLYGDFDINEIIAYFATKGTAIFSNEPDKYYNYQILDQIDYERLVRYRVATVTMHVQPFKYSATEGTLTIDASNTVSGEGSEIALDNTAEAPFTTLRHKGNATQQTYSGKNLADLVPITNGTFSVSNATSETVYDATLGKNVIHIVANNRYPSMVYALPKRLESGKYYAFTFTYKTAEAGTVPANETYWFAPNWKGNNWDNIDIFNYGKGQTASETARTMPSSTWKTTTKRFYIDPTQYASENGSFKNILFSLGYGTGYGSITAKEAWVADAMICEITQAQWEAATYKDEDFEPYVGNLPSPSPDYPQNISLLTGDSTITIDDGGENSQEYVIPFGDTYLAKVGDYADEPVKVGDTWYIRRAIGKAVLDGTETWALNEKGTGYARFTTVLSDIITSFSNSQKYVISDNFTSSTQAETVNALADANRVCVVTNGRILFKTLDAAIDTAAKWQTWLGTHNTTVYYVLATPTDEEITDQDLIDALDEFYEQAHACKGRTHITASAQGDNAPAVLSVEVGENNESTVTNAGNTTSRPIITIYGQGNIGMYINDVQVLDIALGDEQYITIDSVAMEAYKDTTANLKNRLVTGDYNKLALNAGANKIYFTGNVTKYEISKYSRWL